MTHYLVFHKPRSLTPSPFELLFIGRSQIERVFELRYLDLNLDPCLKLKLHIHDVVKKLTNFVPIVYNITYCASACSSTFKSFFDLVFIVQKGIIRAMCGANRRTASQDLFEVLGLLNLTEDLKCVTVAYVYRSLAKLCLNEFSFQAHVRNTRQATQALLFVPNWR